MNLLKLTSAYLNDLLEFNKRIFPDRADVRDHFQFLYVDNPLIENKNNPNGLIAFDEDRKLIGQFMLTPAEYYFDGRRSICFFGCDYFVLEEHRRSGVGALLAMKAINGYRPYFTIGASEDAKKISLSLKTRHIGDLCKFIRLKNVFTPVKFVLKKITGQKTQGDSKSTNFPGSINVKSSCFKLVSLISEWDYQYTDKQYIEFSRSAGFIQWRFFSRPGVYFFYRLENTSCFFVCRVLTWHGLSLLSIVDYRTTLKKSREFDLILKAARKLTTLTGLDGIMTMSSLSFFDRILKKNGFIGTGRPQPVLTNAPVDISPEQIENRNIVYATMADCDIDLNL
ncbi:hypothetical protein JXQ31_06990 [candidate division KSB1 bacterium]|nr:hypothetical protein [candidate division KSB1 bacterium]